MSVPFFLVTTRLDSNFIDSNTTYFCMADRLKMHYLNKSKNENVVF